jgi:O-antigen/teichoic acid export membrane protein
MSALKKLASETAIYGLSSIVGRFLNYLLVPFYTYVFLPAEYGVVTELYAYAAFLNVVFTFGMETTFFRFCNKEGADKTQVYITIQSLLLLSTLFFCLAGFVFASPIAAWLKYPSQSGLIVYLLSIIAIDTLLALSFAKLRQAGRAKKFAFVKLLNIVLNIGLNIFLLVLLPQWNAHFKPDVSMVLLANLLANLVQVVFFASDLKLLFQFSISWPSVKPFLIYGLPLMLMGLAGMVNEVLDRIVLKFLLPEGFYAGLSNLAAVGVYGACYKLSIFMSLGIQAFRYASEPFFFAKSKDKNSPQLYASVMHWFVLVCCGVLLFISLNLDWIQFLLRQPEYREGLVVVPVLLAANLFLGIYYNLSIWYKLTDKTNYGMWISMGGAVVTLVLNVLLVPYFGYVGSAWATLACYLLMALASYVLGQKYFPVPYRLGFVVGAIVVSASFSIVLWDNQLFANEVLNSIVKNVLVLALLFSGYRVLKK